MLGFALPIAVVNSPSFRGNFSYTVTFQTKLNTSLQALLSSLDGRCDS
jgi:hypothetical protein